MMVSIQFITQIMLYPYNGALPSTKEENELLVTHNVMLQSLCGTEEARQRVHITSFRLHKTLKI